MTTNVSRNTKRVGLGSGVAVLKSTLLVAAICGCAAFLLAVADAAQMGLPRTALWEVVHDVCVPGQSERRNPTPCIQVDLSNGIERGFAIIRDPRGGTQFLLIPTTPISGIESPIVRGPDATNYFADAWQVRTHIDEALHLTLPRDKIGLAINSAVSRSQDQLHIHFSCVRADVFEALHRNEARIGPKWAPFRVPLYGRYYLAMWVSGEDLRPYNPFALLAEGLPDAVRDMEDRTLVVIGLTRADGTKGFVILTDQVNKETGDLANGELLLDHTCGVASLGVGLPR